jgi:hypothetical protein
VALEKPAFGQVRVANVRCVWLRHDLQTFQRRLKALETKTAQDSPLLAEDQLRVLQRSREQKDRRG